MSSSNDGNSGVPQASDYALSAQLAAIQGGMGEPIEPCTDLNHHERYRAGWNACLAQHQRITAAMAAEVERWERNFRDIHEPALRDAHAYIQELRAELAEVKGREAVGKVVAISGFRQAAVLLDAYQTASAGQSLVGSKLYALPPASPDVDGLVKALTNLLSYAERQICTHEETHRGGAIWEICDMCGAKWADDEGGKPDFEWPAEIEAARGLLAASTGQEV